MEEFSEVVRNFLSNEGEMQKRGENRINELCRHLYNLSDLFSFLEMSDVSEVKIIAGNCIKKIVENNWKEIGQEDKIMLKTQLIRFLREKGPNLDIRVNKAIIFILVMLIKKGWDQFHTFRHIVSECTPFMEGSFEQCYLGLVIFEELTNEMTMRTKGYSAAKNRNISISYRQSALFEILKLTATCQKECLGLRKDNYTENVQLILIQCLVIIHQCLTFYFCGILQDETLQDPQSTMIPNSWREIIVNNNLLVTFADIFFHFTSQRMQQLALKNIVELVNCNIGLFQGEEQKSQFMGEIVEILRKLFVYPIVSGDSEILLIVIEILEKFIKRFKLEELEKMNLLAGFLENISDFTHNIIFLNEMWIDAGAQICLIWNQLILDIYRSSSSFIKLIDNYSFQIAIKFIHLNISSNNQIGLKERVEIGKEIEQRTSVFDIVAKLCSYNYEQILPLLRDKITDLNTEELLWEEKKGIEMQNKLGWIIRIMCAMIGQQYFNSKTFKEDEQMQFEIYAQIFKFILSDINYTSLGYKCRLSKELELSLIVFVNQFAKGIIGSPQAIISTKEGEYVISSFDLEEISKLLPPNHQNIIEIILIKIRNNLIMSCEEELTNCTLNTLKSLAHGYNTGKLLSQSASIKDMLLQHLRMGSLTGNVILPLKTECRIYEIICPFMLQEEKTGSSCLWNYLLPFQAILDKLSTQNIYSLQLRGPLLRVLFVLRGILSGIKNPQTFNIFFEWIYPKYLGKLTDTSLQLFREDSELINAILKFVQELAFNRVQRLTFELNNINGLLLFRLLSQFIIYFVSTFHLSHINLDQYAEKYKHLHLCVKIMTNCMEGNYINFGVFKLYNDLCFINSSKVIFTLIIEHRLKIMEYEKVHLGVFEFLTVMCKKHSSLLLLNMGDGVIEGIFALLLQGISSPLSSILRLSAHALDHIHSYIIYILSSFTLNSKLKRNLTNIFNAKQHCFHEILSHILKSVINSEEGEYWNLAKPLLSGLLLNEKLVDSCIQNVLIQIFPNNPKNSLKVKQEFNSLLEKITDRKLNSVTKEKFTKFLHAFKLNIKELLNEL